MRDTNVIVEAVRKANKAKADSGPTAASGGLEAEAGLADGAPHHNVVKLNEAVLFENRIFAALRKDTRVEPYNQLRTQVLKVLRR